MRFRDIAAVVLQVKVVLGPYCLCLCQIWCKSVQKWRIYCRLSDFKMAAAAMLVSWIM